MTVTHKFLHSFYKWNGLDILLDADYLQIILYAPKIMGKSTYCENPLTELHSAIHNKQFLCVHETWDKCKMCFVSVTVSAVCRDEETWDMTGLTKLQGKSNIGQTHFTIPSRNLMCVRRVNRYCLQYCLLSSRCGITRGVEQQQRRGSRCANMFPA